MNSPLQKHSGHYRQLNALNPGLQTLSDGLSGLVADGHPVPVCTADLQYSNGLSKFAKSHPDRFIQYGISKKNMVSAAAKRLFTRQAPT